MTRKKRAKVGVEAAGPNGLVGADRMTVQYAALSWRFIDSWRFCLAGHGHYWNRLTQATRLIPPPQASLSRPFYGADGSPARKVKTETCWWHASASRARRK